MPRTEALPELPRLSLLRTGVVVLLLHLGILVAIVRLSRVSRQPEHQTLVSIEVGAQPVGGGAVGAPSAPAAHPPAHTRRLPAHPPMPPAPAPTPTHRTATGMLPTPAPATPAPPTTAQAAAPDASVQSTSTPAGGAAAPSTAPTRPDGSAAYLHNPKPVYPLLAYRAHIEGTVIVRALVNADGSCAKALVGTSSGSELLDQAAMAAVSQWKFVAATHAGKPVQDWVNIPITFSIHHR